jgi:hypothetical protein
VVELEPHTTVVVGSPVSVAFHLITKSLIEFGEAEYPESCVWVVDDTLSRCDRFSSQYGISASTVCAIDSVVVDLDARAHPSLCYVDAERMKLVCQRVRDVSDVLAALEGWPTEDVRQWIATVDAELQTATTERRPKWSPAEPFPAER